MAGFSTSSIDVGLDVQGAVHWIIAGSAVALIAPNVYELFRNYRVGLGSKGYPATEIGRTESHITIQLSPIWGAVFGVCLGVIVLKMSDISEFIYFQF